MLPGRRAEVVGKPSPAFFELTLCDLGLPTRKVLVVGDDPEAEAPRPTAGPRVLTGRMEGEDASLLAVRPDLVLDSIADLG